VRRDLPKAWLCHPWDKLTAGGLRMNHATRDTKFIICSLQNSWLVVVLMQINFVLSTS